MTTRRCVVTLRLRDGLHARPCARIAELAAGFSCRVSIRKGEREADAASLLELMGLIAGEGDALEVEAHGADAAFAVAQICAVLAPSRADG
ncbi:MAG: HPr family phosphocarrier protein [Planctomycetes bacterium]|nr:HPr family phosphocarrier protein [Planctomycetota bacterium]